MTVRESYNFGVDTKAKQLYTKTTVDDIIGVVKTDEPTNSVTLKKEAQLSICEKRLIELEKENEQLKQRNKNQYEQLTQLWKLIENEDYNTLRSMLNQLEEDEERLQQEWGTYGDAG